MKLTKEQKNRIYNKNTIVDNWEWVPCINHVLRILNYDDNLIHDENYETVKWSGTEPLIKDEKIRKAVRAWAEMNGIRFIRMCSRTRKENARIVGQNALGRTFTMEIDNEYEIRVSFKDYKKCYTIDELCGEEA